jgi:hypothetical protein
MADFAAVVRYVAHRAVDGAAEDASIPAPAVASAASLLRAGVKLTITLRFAADGVQSTQLVTTPAEYDDALLSALAGVFDGGWPAPTLHSLLAAAATAARRNELARREEACRTALARATAEVAAFEEELKAGGAPPKATPVAAQMRPTLETGARADARRPPRETRSSCVDFPGFGVAKLVGTGVCFPFMVDDVECFFDGVIVKQFGYDRVRVEFCDGDVRTYAMTGKQGAELAEAIEEAERREFGGGGDGQETKRARL